MLLSVIETAETLGCSAQYVRKLLREGRLAGQKIGDSWIINDDTLESFDRKDLRTKKNDVPDRKSRKAPKQGALNCLSFFSGAMGLDIGLEQEGINILLACETDNACRRTIVANEPGIGLIGDIRDYTAGRSWNMQTSKKTGRSTSSSAGRPPGIQHGREKARLPGRAGQCLSEIHRSHPGDTTAVRRNRKRKRVVFVRTFDRHRR